MWLFTILENTLIKRTFLNVIWPFILSYKCSGVHNKQEFVKTNDHVIQFFIFKKENYHFYPENNHKKWTIGQNTHGDVFLVAYWLIDYDFIIKLRFLLK